MNHKFPPAYTYAPLIRYRYEVNGKEFVNNYIHPKRIQLPRHSTRSWAQKRADEIPDAVVVHYNPSDPGESFFSRRRKEALRRRDRVNYDHSVRGDYFQRIPVEVRSGQFQLNRYQVCNDH